MSTPPQISVLIPSWNNLEMLKLCLGSISQHSQLRTQVIVHVNEGTDGTREWVEQNDVEHTYTETNVGISRAMNLAASKTTADYLVYLNDDMYVLPGWDVALYQAAKAFGTQSPAYFSGTMVQRKAISPSDVIGDYGSNPQSFDRWKLLGDFYRGKLTRDDWNGATWPPSCVHRKWWDQVNGYSEELVPGFYSDIDFSMKLWGINCRHYRGIGNSLVYHFSETTTSLLRGPRKENVRRARIQFLAKWGILPSTFCKYYLRAGEPFLETTLEPELGLSQWERLRLGVLSTLHRARLRAA